ncbi:MAG: hypothetical protein K9L68_05105 [Spirochaetales bacterium]|nr:hypothetical protein [Spirochaetales bacterium]MCF7937957.1 hypothetical protein [Spirochaetales bacterium]
MTKKEIQSVLKNKIKEEEGIFRLDPAWVARDFLPPGKRLGLKDEEYDVGERGHICERWLASVTHADNAVGPEDEGLSYLRLDGSEYITLKDGVDADPELFMGKEYAANHSGLGRLAKLYDYDTRLPYHVHQKQEYAAKVGANSKDEAYYFPEGVPPGPHPETYFGVHPYIVEQGLQYKVLQPLLEQWSGNEILKHSRAYANVPGEGFFLPSGILHAPGSALTIELQEDSDVFAMLQAEVSGYPISKELLYKDIAEEDRQAKRERSVLDQLDWEANGDPYFYENHHLEPVVCGEQPGGTEWWIYYGTKKFSGKRIIVKPGGSFETKEKGVYSVLVWQGKGTFAGKEIEAGNFEKDELIVTHDRAVKPLVVENTGSEDLLLIKFFGPDINPDCPMIEPYTGK